MSPIVAQVVCLIFALVIFAFFMYMVVKKYESSDWAVVYWMLAVLTLVCITLAAGGISALATLLACH